MNAPACLAIAAASGKLSGLAGTRASDLASAMRELYATHEDEVKRLAGFYVGVGLPTLILLALTDKFVNDFYQRFAELSKKYSTYTVACNSMAPFNKSGDRYLPSEGAVYNEAFIFDPNGGLVASQRKVFLTDMEKELGISGWDLSGVSVFKVGGRGFGVAISLDAFCPEYVSRLSGAEIVVEPDANPVKWASYLDNGRWQPEEWMDSSYYIAQRLGSVKYVVNPFLVGSILGVEFEGQSNITKKASAKDVKLGYIGNIPVTGFHSILPAGSFEPTEFVGREEASNSAISYSDGVVCIEVP
ncbi:MAG: hypothetical protein QW514_09090 [Thermoprotei archaeon]